MKTNCRGFHDIDIDFEGIMVEGGLVDELFRLQDLKIASCF